MVQDNSEYRYVYSSILYWGNKIPCQHNIQSNQILALSEHKNNIEIKRIGIMRRKWTVQIL